MKPENVRLMLTCSARGRTIPIAYVLDQGFIRKAARLAISEARKRAKFLDEVDPVLGATERAESNRIAEILSSVG